MNGLLLSNAKSATNQVQASLVIQLLEKNRSFSVQAASADQKNNVYFLTQTFWDTWISGTLDGSHRDVTDGW